MELETIDALLHTKKHEAHILKVVNSFITVLSSDAQNIWENLLKLNRINSVTARPSMFLPFLLIWEDTDHLKSYR